MKILHIITRLILGGAQENTVLSCEGQQRSGHDVTLAFGPIYGPEGSLYDRAAASGCRLVELSAMKRAILPGSDWRCYRQCLQLIREVKPDIVHTHSSKAGIIGRMAAWKLGVPAVIHTIHGLPFHPYQSRLKNAIYIAAERKAAKRCHRIVTVADAMTRQALAAGVGRPEQYVTIYSGMEIDHYLADPHDRAATRAELGLTDNDIVIGTVARLAELKGHDDLLDALAGALLGILPGELPGILPGAGGGNVKLLWVGDGWWRPRLEKRIAEMGMSGRVVMTGLVPSDQVPKYMRAMDVMAHPSYREGLPRTVPQGLLSGVPVVSYDCDGAGEACIDGQTGLLVKTGDIAGLGRALRWMVEHPAKRREMAGRGREFCAKRFDTRVMVEELDRLYRQVLQERTATGKF